MSKKVTSLTDEQVAKMPEYVKEFVGYGLALEEIPKGKTYDETVDKEQARKDVDLLYTIGGLKPPKELRFFDSPAAMYRHIQEISPKSAIDRLMNASGYGHHDVSFLAFYSFFRRECGLVEETESIHGLMAMLKYGWYYPTEEICFISARPVELHQDGQGRLHYTDGPALAYNDGFAIYAVNGTAIPGEWVEKKDEVDPQLALTWENIEQRRALAELLGWDKILTQVKAKRLHKDEYGELLEANLPDAPRQRFVRVVCGTGRIFAIPVPSDVKTALEAVARTYRVTPEEYKQLQVRT